MPKKKPPKLEIPQSDDWKAILGDTEPISFSTTIEQVEKSPYAEMVVVMGDSTRIKAVDIPPDRGFQLEKFFTQDKPPQRLQYREVDKDGEFIRSVTWWDVKFGEPQVEETDEALVINLHGTYTKKPRVYRRRKKT